MGHREALRYARGVSTKPLRVVVPPPAEPAIEGAVCSTGQLAQLQLVSPFVLPESLTTLLRSRPLLGAGMRLTLNGVAHVVAFFNLERIIEEVLQHEPAGRLLGCGLLPIGGCGQRGTGLYLVDVRSPGLQLWQARGLEPAKPCGLGLIDALETASASAVSARRRLPAKRPKRVARGAERSDSGVPLCDRTLPLF